MASLVSAAELAAAIVALVASATITVTMVVRRVEPWRRRVAQRWQRWLDASVGKILDGRLNATNGGSTIMDRVSAVEIHSRDTQRAVEVVDGKLDLMVSQMATVAETSRERAELAEHRADRIETRMDEGFSELRRVLMRFPDDRPAGP
jgi:hypothetical protein